MNQFLALTSFGIEALLADELKTLGADNVVQKPEGVYFQSDLKTAYHIVLWTRLASRVLLQLGKQPAADKHALYNAAKSVYWPDVFDHHSSFAIDFVGKSEAIRDSQFGALTVKDAVVDQFREAELGRPSVHKMDPDIRIQARLLKGEVALYLDFSGRSLFQRGYREGTGAAPLKENLAAAMIIRSGWLEDTTKPLIDPMCGSGTILIEAASMASKQAPALKRENWGFYHWIGHNQQAWLDALNDAEQTSEQGLASCELSLLGNELDNKVLKTARANVQNAGFARFIKLQQGNAKNLQSHFEATGTILFNPPYGERIGSLPELVDVFSHLGRLFKAAFADWRVAILTANTELLSLLKLSSKKRYKFKNGPLDCQFALYDIDQKQLERTEQIQQEMADKFNGDSAFANRLKKNIKALKGWVKSENIDCYRIYDADIPEYNVAIDIYGDHIVIQEYAAPGYMDERKTAERLQEVIYWAPKVLVVDPNKVSLKTRSKQKGANQYQKMSQRRDAMIVNEYGAKLKVNLWDYLDTGLFLDHRKTRQIVAKEAKGKSLLNLFSYTGSVSVQAALHGAESVTTVDMSKTYLEWAKENFELNNLKGHKYPFIQADCLQWLKENRSQFDVIFIDPPTFSNSKRMENTFDVQRDHIGLIKDALKGLADGGTIIFTNNKRNFKFDLAQAEELGLRIEAMSSKTLDRDFKRNPHIHNSWKITRKN